MASVVQVATGATTFDITCTATLATPATAGNVLVAVMTGNRAEANIVVPAGWTELTRNSNGGGCNIATASVIATGGETSVTMTQEHTSGSRLLMTVYELNGVGQTPTFIETNVGASNSHTVGPLTDSGIFIAGVSLDNIAANPEAWGGWTDGFTTDSEFNSEAGSNNVAQSCGHKVVATDTSTSSTQSWTTLLDSTGVLMAFPGPDGLGEGSATGTYAADGSAAGDNGEVISQPTFVGYTAADGEAATSFDLPLPAGTVAGDAQLVFGMVSSSTETLTAPAGWTTLVEDIMDKGDGQTQHLYVFQSTTDTGTATFTKSGALRDCHIVRAAWTGQGAIVGGTVQQNTVASTTHAIPGVTTTTDNSLVIGMVFSEDINGQVNTEPAGWTERIDAEAQTDDLSICVADFLDTTAGSVTGSFSTGTAVQSQTFSIVLEPFGGSGSVASTTDWAGTATGDRPNSGSATGSVDWSKGDRTPQFIGTSEITSATGLTDLVIPAPTGSQVGDFQLVAIGLASTTESITAVPSGWDLVGTLDSGTDFATHIYTSITDAGSATFTRDGTGAGHVVRLAWRGHADFGTGHIQASTGTSHAIVTETTTTDNSWVLGVVHMETSAVFDAPAGWSERYDAVGDGQAITVADLEKLTAGIVDGSFTSSTAGNANVFSIILDAVPPDSPTGTAAGGFDLTVGTVTGEQPPGNGTVTGSYDLATTTAGERSPVGSSGPEIYAFDEQNAGKRVPKGSQTGGVDFSATQVTGFLPGSNRTTGSYDYEPVVTGITDREGSASPTVDFSGVVEGGPTQKGTASGTYDLASSVVGETPIVVNEGTAEGGFNFHLPVTVGDRPAEGTTVQGYAFAGSSEGEPTPFTLEEGHTERLLIFNHGNIFGTRESAGTVEEAQDFTGVVVGKGPSIVYRFEPPTHQLVVPDRRPAYQLTWSTSVVRINGVLTEYPYPPAALLVGDEGVDYFLGGHVYEIDPDISDELNAAGFTTYRI